MVFEKSPAPRKAVSPSQAGPARLWPLLLRPSRFCSFSGRVFLSVGGTRKKVQQGQLGWGKQRQRTVLQSCLCQESSQALQPAPWRLSSSRQNSIRAAGLQNGGAWPQQRVQEQEEGFGGLANGHCLATAAAGPTIGCRKLKFR